MIAMNDTAMRKIISHVRSAVEDYDMIADGDRIAVGVSGGKDSLVLLCVLAKLAEFYPKKFTVVGLTLETGYGADFSKVKALCEKLGVEYHVKATNIKEVVFDIRKESNPCSLCANLRRGALNTMAKEYGCNKIALGHHNDDVLETFFLSLMYEGRISCFDPVTYLNRIDITLLRPMIYVRERDVKAAARNNELPIVKNPCPADGATKRQDMKELIARLEHEQHPGLRKRLFHAVQYSGMAAWKPNKKHRMRDL